MEPTRRPQSFPHKAVHLVRPLYGCKSLLRLHISPLLRDQCCLLPQAVYLGCITLHILEILFSPPKRYPDLYPVLNVLLSTPIFVLTWLWSIKSLLESYWVIGPLGFGESSAHHPLTTDSRAPSEIGTPVTEKGSSVVGSIGRERGLRARSLGYSSAMAKGGNKRLSKAGSVDEVPE